uniref:Peptidase C1A papain C-terminal domain-containing protein n=1 Tax=Peronospora matthiolae TaxID=2874970 RepID=A0AAV1TZF1_9STRA
MSSSYGAMRLTGECDPFMSSPVSQVPPRTNRSWKTMALVATLVVAMSGFAAIVQSSLAAQQERLAKLEHHLLELKAVYAAALTQQRVPPVEFQADSLISRTSFAVDHVTPLKTQDERGTCWDFATIAILENSFRQQGITRGWLQKTEYLALSEQAYGAEVLRLCAGPADSPQQVACLIPGNGVWKNTTEGGDATLLLYLMNGLKDNIYPDSVCAYDPYNDRNDTVCAALTPENRKVNPLRLTIRSMETLMDEASIKRAMMTHGQVMSLTTALPYTTRYYPCIGKRAGEDQCDPASTSCSLCPPELSMTTCCVPLEKGESYNMNGEFITSHVMNPEGGHVMALVGYNDLYRTKQGFTGGFILKNSWFDGIHPALGPMHARGSHSLKYWLQEITEWEEASICPNSRNPENWYQCGNTDEVISSKRHGDPSMNIPLPIDRSTSPGIGVDSCLSQETELYARVSFQPLHLHCTDSFFCAVNDDYTYFVRNTTTWGDRMLRMCLFEYNTVTGKSSEFCLPPLLAQKIAYVLSPVVDEIRENDPDACGFYFYPYEVQRQYKAQFGSFYVNDFDIEWHAQSYAANKALYPNLDYSDVERSTRKQKRYDFVGPFPFARIVGKEDLPSVIEV